MHFYFQNKKNINNTRDASSASQISPLGSGQKNQTEVFLVQNSIS
jgi:hypothetical protein